MKHPHSIVGAAPGTRVLLVHFGELALKRRNRGNFENQLASNIRDLLGGLIEGVPHRPRGRMIFPLSASASVAAIAQRMSAIYGVANFTTATVAELNIDAICAAAVEQALAATEIPADRPFAIRARRADKNFPLATPEINRIVGSAVAVATGRPVDLEQPELEIRIEVIEGLALVSRGQTKGAGGLPVGSGGRVTVLLSGGIDSPVAAELMMKRGCRVRFVHFHSAPFTSAASQEKAIELAALVAARQGQAKIDLVPFAVVQQEIIAHAPSKMRVLLYRRFMVRIAAALATRHHTMALVTGESLGQVASQTLENLSAIEAISPLPILRPLLTYDKEEIIARARKIGTFELSITPHDDCCSFMMPPKVATRATAQDLDAAESALDIPALVELGLAGVSTEQVP